MRRRLFTLAALRPIPVDLALVLAIDVSGSVTTQRLHLQFQGYADAFRAPSLHAALRQGRHGRIAVAFVQWSDAHRQYLTIDWTLLSDAASALGFGQAIATALLAGPGWTSISGAIDYGVRLFARSGVTATRRVIDISGDGRNNDGRPAEQARDDAVAAGVTINGLPLLGQEPDIEAYYRARVIGGDGCFVVPVRDENDFAGAVLRKLLLEVAGGPVPGRRYASL